MECPYCGAELEARSYGEPKRTVMVCPKDYVIKHPRLIYVPKIDYDVALSPTK